MPPYYEFKLHIFFKNLHLSLDMSTQIVYTICAVHNLCTKTNNPEVCYDED